MIAALIAHGDVSMTSRHTKGVGDWSSLAGGRLPQARAIALPLFPAYAILRLVQGGNVACHIWAADESKSKQSRHDNEARSGKFQ
jgi:hypothetical protein